MDGNERHQPGATPAPLIRSRGLHAQFALLAAALAMVSLAGWLSGTPWLTTLAPGRPSLSPLTAVLLLLAAAGIALLPTRPARALRLGAAVAAGGVLAAAVHLVDGGPPGPQAWWPSPFTAGAFVLSGASTVLMAAGHRAYGQVVAFAVLLIVALLGLGHVFPSADLYAFLPGTGVAIPTVLAFMALSVAQLLSFAQAGVSAAFTSRNAAGRLGLRLLLAGAAGAVAVVGAVVVAYQRGLFDAVTAVLLLGWGSMALLGATLWGLTVAVDRAEIAWSAAEHERNQVRRLVVAALSHDLRTPLQAATLATHLLEQRVTDQRALQAVQRLQRSHQRIERLLSSLLDSLAVGAGQPLALRATACHLGQVVREVVADNSASLGDRVQLHGSAQGWWDPDAMFRVVENLLLNAVKYGEPGTPIECRIGALAGQVELTVANRGAAIPGSDWDSIFEPFTRAQSALDADAEGWGVGLAYARSVATSHGGTVRVASSGDRATVFELRLPQDSRPWLKRGES